MAEADLLPGNLYCTAEGVLHPALNNMSKF